VTIETINIWPHFTFVSSQRFSYTNQMSCKHYEISFAFKSSIE